jgi:hypothetical protein
MRIIKGLVLPVELTHYLCGNATGLLIYEVFSRYLPGVLVPAVYACVAHSRWAAA